MSVQDALQEIIDSGFRIKMKRRDAGGRGITCTISKRDIDTIVQWYSFIPDDELVAVLIKLHHKALEKI